jgi:hypothetical protein
MTPEQTSQFITSKRIRSQHVMTKDMEYELSQKYFVDDIHARFTHEIVKRFTDEMVASRCKDVKIEEGSHFFDNTTFTLELFVFNRQELNTFIEAIKMNDWSPRL